jgi:type I restriction enzyme S subunit
MEKAYETYKDSRYEWFRNIPSEWQIISFKYLVNKIYTGGTPTTSNSNYWVDKGQGIPWVAISDITKSNKFLLDTKKEISEDGRASKGLDILPKDTLLLSIFASLGKTVRLGVEATVNQAILGLETNEKLSVDFLEYLFVDAERYISYYSSMSTQENLNLSKIRSLNFPIPPKKEQTQIATYLDYHTQLIDTLISKKETLIQKLQEQRQAIINEAVTKGLNKDVALKDSGIEWLGEIPEHWEVVKLFHLSENIGSGTTPKSDKREYYDGNIGWLNTGDLNDGFVKTASKNITEKALNDYSVLKIYPANSVVIALYGATIGKLAIIGDEMTTNQACCVLNPNDKLNYKFLFYLLMASRPYLLSLSYGGGQPNISQEIIKQLRVSLPEIKEQEQIIEKLEKRLDGIDVSTEKIKTSIQKLKDYRQSLISEAVTGKIDVRDWQRPIN